MQSAWLRTSIVAVGVGLLCAQVNADEAVFAKVAPVIDGSGALSAWQNAPKKSVSLSKEYNP